MLKIILKSNTVIVLTYLLNKFRDKITGIKLIYKSRYQMTKIKRKVIDDIINKLKYLLEESNVKKLSINQIQLNDNEIRKLAKALPKTQITNLYLPGVIYSQIKGQQVLFKILPQTRISHLNLSINGLFSVMKLKNLLKVLPNTPQLVYLSLRSNNIGNNGATELARVLKDTQITHLNLADNLIGTRGMKALDSVLSESKITHINLDSNIINVRRFPQIHDHKWIKKENI